ncbi:hypothetical protein [Actinomadura livida]|uniref:Putative integral membrane protein n=1 Tax=Actinomadura livida TaxID=79909 RepID=A0A7W7I901_9ACTN|nr:MULTISPECIES: hypothetical protein [Actinomadura]MBB4772712.1 putative integral membrane protein [Actinomadura catellatispora]GGU12302.1 hypothetical protein GCM10010208_41270 [Actinomadura livida]
MQTSHRPRVNGRTGQAGSVSQLHPPGPRVPDRREPPPAQRTATAVRTSVVWSELWAVAAILFLFMVLVVSNTGDVRISFAGLSGVLPLAVVLMAAMAAGIAVTLILGSARLTQLRPLTRKRLR